MKLLLSAEEIATRVKAIGHEISSHYQGRDLVVVGILKGSYMFLADLVRQINLTVQLDFARLSSYADAVNPIHDVKILMDVETPLHGRDVLIVDDILDTGRSMLAFKEHLAKQSPASVKICTMLDKTYRRAVPITPDFYGFRLEEGFVVGYGLDYGERYRTLPDIYVLDPT